MAGRSHSTWSASSTARNWGCPGALALCAKVPEQPESEPAAWGTACHEVSEDCLREGRDPTEWIGRTIRTKEHAIEVDEEMAETARTYVDYVRGRFGASALNVLHIEQRFSLAALNPPFDAGGTADAVIYHANERRLEVIDLKGGRGVVVEAEGNKQLRTYALGAVLANPALDVGTVQVTIVQPRAGRDAIRSEEFDPVELMEWTSDLMQAMRSSALAMEAYGEVRGEVSREEWGETNLRAGEHCRFCPARAICPAQEKAALDAAGVWFDDLDQPQLKNAPDELDPARLARVLDAAGMIEDWLNAVRALAHNLAQAGTEIPGYVLVEKIGRRRWKDEAAAEVALSDLPDDVVFETKLRSIAQIEKALGAKRKREFEGLLSSLVETPVTGLNLVRAGKTTRPAVKGGSAHSLLSPVEG
jgi:hypothetical protein